jgi:hypothetical protein
VKGHFGCVLIDKKEIVDLIGWIMWLHEIVEKSASGFSYLDIVDSRLDATR